ncbi:MAG: acetyl-CoA carboxylase biotin carboxyl carrier protein [Saccharofermentanales bacterium]
MNVEQIKELISIVEKSNISSFELEEEGYKIRIAKELTPKTDERQTIYLPAGNAAFGGSAQNFQEQPKVCVTDEAKTEERSYNEIRSPMLGVFYSSPAPDEQPFVKVGDRVKKGDVLCIIEAMKLMNEILAEKEGEIAEINVENGQIVEFSQVLFKLK